jgi:SHS2 domain-containing protein
VTKASYRFFDHTGDFGVEVRAPDRAGAVAAVARAFLELLTDAPGAVEEREEREVVVEGLDPADVLVVFGNELLFLFEAEGFLCARFEAADVDETAIEGTAWGEPFDPDRHAIARPIKAVTHHMADLREDSGGVTARLIFDL